jgi:hypothetical protein
MKTATMKFSVVVAAFAAFGPVLAGSLDPAGPPAPTMVTVQQVYQRVQHPLADTCFDNGGRFVDCANGTVKDTVTGLFWLKNANCFNTMNWAAANVAAANLASGQCGLTDGSSAGAWRLPTQSEWQAILTSSCSNPALPDRAGTGCFTGTPWATNVQATQYYWSSTTISTDPLSAWAPVISCNCIYPGPKGNGLYVWPVRGGQ